MKDKGNGYNCICLLLKDQVDPIVRTIDFEGITRIDKVGGVAEISKSKE